MSNVAVMITNELCTDLAKPYAPAEVMWKPLTTRGGGYCPWERVIAGSIFMH
ncbi:hypothetical protein JYU34_009403 [Plutella xylostella]|uniref:Uncharacterized protein n=1 Tax=Plutella xylostella TaxID=51655 RepID=A0ABQ7QKM7_PLUXY|nr:hypothetical protein JYU34_009403 [Plutella xylostella]